MPPALRTETRDQRSDKLRDQLRSTKDAALDAFARRAFAKAAALYQRVAVAEPFDPGWRQRAGESLRKAGRPVDASAEFFAAAQTYATGGFTRQARALCSLAVQVDPYNRNAWLLRERLR